MIHRPLAMALAAAAAMLAAVQGGAEPAGIGAAIQPPMPGVANPARARIDYMLKCQGCHQPDGSGNLANTPPLKGEVAKFLSVPGGREFLARVPGVASVDLDDARLADVVNYTLHKFDAAHLPEGFEPYTAEELGRLRKAPLRLERAAAREALVARIQTKSGG